MTKFFQWALALTVLAIIAWLLYATYETAMFVKDQGLKGVVQTFWCGSLGCKE